MSIFMALWLFSITFSVVCYGLYRHFKPEALPKRHLFVLLAFLLASIVSVAYTTIYATIIAVNAEKPWDFNIFIPQAVFAVAAYVTFRLVMLAKEKWRKNITIALTFLAFMYGAQSLGDHLYRVFKVLDCHGMIPVEANGYDYIYRLWFGQPVVYSCREPVTKQWD